MDACSSLQEIFMLIATLSIWQKSIDRMKHWIVLNGCILFHRELVMFLYKIWNVIGSKMIPSKGKDRFFSHTNHKDLCNDSTTVHYNMLIFLPPSVPLTPPGHILMHGQFSFTKVTANVTQICLAFQNQVAPPLYIWNISFT